ncbi:MAG: S8 family serine peptidase, partial [Planctomycetota bacterium]
MLASNYWHLATAATYLILSQVARAQADVESAGPDQTRIWSLVLEHDEELQAAARQDLAAWRRSSDADGFAARVAALRERVAVESTGVRSAALEVGAEWIGETTLVPTLIVRATRAQAARLAQLPGVIEVVADERRQPALAEATAAHGLPSVHGMALGGTPVEGAGVTIAVLDSGIDLTIPEAGRPHAAFYPEGDPSIAGPGIDGSRILSSEFFGLQGDCSGLPSPGEDETGHGTRVTAIAAGADWNDQPSISDGAAPSANIRSYKVTDCTSSLASTTSMEIA